MSSETPPVSKFCLSPSRPLISGGPAESEGVAVGWERVIEPSVEEAELDIGKTSPTGLGTVLVHARLVLKEPLFPGLSLSLPDNDKSVRMGENSIPSGSTKGSERHLLPEQRGLGTNSHNSEVVYSCDPQRDLLLGGPITGLLYEKPWDSVSSCSNP